MVKESCGQTALPANNDSNPRLERMVLDMQERIEKEIQERVAAESSLWEDLAFIQSKTANVSETVNRLRAKCSGINRDLADLREGLVDLQLGTALIIPFPIGCLLNMAKSSILEKCKATYVELSKNRNRAQVQAYVMSEVSLSEQAVRLTLWCSDICDDVAHRAGKEEIQEAVLELLPSRQTESPLRELFEFVYNTDL